MIRTFSCRLENNQAFKWISDKFSSIPGKVSEIYLYVLFLSNPGEKALKGIVHYITMCILKEQAVNEHYDGIILPFWAWQPRRKSNLKNACKWISENFPAMLTYVLFLENLHAWLFSNPQGKDHLIGWISCSLNLRVQPSFYSLDIRVFKNTLVINQTGKGNPKILSWICEFSYRVQG